MYTLADYGSMVADRVRVHAYAEALRASIRQNSIAVEIGTGPGIFAVLACQLGARRVYAIEPGHIIQLAREIAAANHCADRIEFIQDLSTRVSLPERADVIVSDLRGVLPVFQNNVTDLIDAQNRFLAPGGIMIPRSDSLLAAVVEDPDLYSRCVDSWKNNALEQDLIPAQRLAANELHKARLKPEQLLTSPHSWATLNYVTLTSPNVAGEFCAKSNRAGVGHGLLVWFDTVLADNIGFSNAPGAPESIYGAMFFPWPRPVNLTPGQSVRADLQAKFVGSDYVWCWNTRIHSHSDSEKIGTRFEQSQLHGLPVSLSALHKAGSKYIPQLSEEGRLHIRAFALIDGQRTLESIARVLAEEFPQHFSRWQDALTYAGRIAQEYSL